MIRNKHEIGYRSAKISPTIADQQVSPSSTSLEGTITYLRVLGTVYVNLIKIITLIKS